MEHSLKWDKIGIQTLLHSFWEGKHVFSPPQAENISKKSLINKWNTHFKTVENSLKWDKIGILTAIHLSGMSHLSEWLLYRPAGVSPWHRLGLYFFWAENISSCLFVSKFSSSRASFLKNPPKFSSPPFGRRFYLAFPYILSLKIFLKTLQKFPQNR